MDINLLSVICSIAAAILQVWGYHLYTKRVYRHEINPSATPWFLWAFGSGVAAWSYIMLSTDYVKDFLPVTCAIVCMLTFLFIARRGHFGKPESEDIFIIGLDFAVIAIWLFQRDAIVTNIAMQVDALISFLPMFRDTWRNPASEKSAPWFTWSAAYFLMAVAVGLRFEGWWGLMYPVVYFGLHMAIGLIAHFRTAKT